MSEKELWEQFVEDVQDVWENGNDSMEGSESGSGLNIDGTAESLTQFEDPGTEVSQKERAAVPTKMFRSKLDSSIQFQMKLYRDSSKKQKFRAVLSIPGTSVPKREHYCDSMREAVKWVREKGEDELFRGVDISHFRETPQKMTLMTAFRLMAAAPEARSFRAYFQENEELLENLSQWPVATLSVENCGEALRETFDEERERMEAVSHLNRLLGLCHVRGLRSAPLRLKFNDRKYDRNLRALHRALVPRVLPEDLQRRIYQESCKRVLEDPYYLAVLLQLTMGLSISEVAGLQYRDLCDGRTDVQADEPWTIPEGPMWYFRVRRFNKRIRMTDSTGRKTSKCVTMKTENVFKYRLVVIPLQMKEILEEYVVRFGAEALGNTPLIPAKRDEGGGITLDGARHFTKAVLAEYGVKDLKREVPLPSSDGLHEDTYETLSPTLTVFQSNMEYQLERCGFQPHEIRSYLGRSPVAVLDEHYWENKTKMAQLRQLRKLARWNLRETAEGAVDMQHLSWKAERVDAELPSEAGQVVSAVLTVRGNRGAPIYADISVPYGFDCEYVITHSQPKPETDDP